MAWTGLTLTVEGQNALNKAQLSNKMNIKSIVVGDGKTPQNFRTLKGLVNQLYEITELKIDMNADGCVITADFPKVDYDYYFREIGVIVTTESDGEKLYVYDNCGDDAQYIVSSTGAEDIKKRMRLSLTISGVAEITVSNPNILYVAYDDFENEIQTLHHTKVSSDGGDASELVVDFEHKELEPLSSGETLSVTLGKAAKAVADFIGHIENKSNPHEVTKSQVGLSNVPNVTTDDQAPTFTQASLRANISSGETLSVTLGKIMKWFADMKAAAFAGLANNCTTTVEGYALDARQGKALQDKVSEINSNLNALSSKYNSINTEVKCMINQYSGNTSVAANSYVNLIQVSPSNNNYLYLIISNCYAQSGNLKSYLNTNYGNTYQNSPANEYAGEATNVNVVRGGNPVILYGKSTSATTLNWVITVVKMGKF